MKSARLSLQDKLLRTHRRSQHMTIALQLMKNLLPKRLVVLSTRSKSGCGLTADREDPPFFCWSSPNFRDEIGFAARAVL